MKRCAICGANIQNADIENTLFLFHSEKTGKEFYACEKCAARFSQLMESGNSKSVQTAVNYFYTYIDKVEDSEVRDYLSEIVEGNTEVAEDLPQKEEKKKPVDERQRDYSEEKANREGAAMGWIRMLRASAWIVIIACIVCGLIAGVCTFSVSGGLGLLIIVLSIVVPFLGVGALMVFLDMAEDLKAIRSKLEGKKK